MWSLINILSNFHRTDVMLWTPSLMNKHHVLHLPLVNAVYSISQEYMLWKSYIISIRSVLHLSRINVMYTTSNE